MVLTNVGVAVAGKWYKRKLKYWNCTKGRNRKISNSVEMWFNAIGSTTNHEGVVITSVHSRYEKAAWPFVTFAYRPAAIFLSLISLPFLYASLSFPSCLARIILNSLLSFPGRNFSKTILVVLLTNFAAYRPNRPALHFLPNDLIGSHLNGCHLENSSINKRRTAIAFITLYSLFPRGETLFLFPLNIILELNLNSEIILRHLQNLS